jgi:hypothetical protein
MLAELFWESKPPLWVISYANRYRINQLSVSIGFDLLRKQYKLRTQWFIVYVVFKSSHLQYVHYFFDHKKGTVLRASIESFPKYFQNGLFLSSVRCSFCTNDYWKSIIYLYIFDAWYGSYLIYTECIKHAHSMTLYHVNRCEITLP